METWHQSVLLDMRTCKIVWFGNHMVPVMGVLCIHSYNTLLTCLLIVWRNYFRM